MNEFVKYLNTSRIISVDNYVPLEVSQRLYDEMTAGANFNESLVSNVRGEYAAETDTPYQQIKHNGRISQTAYSHTFPEIVAPALEKIRENVAGLLEVELDRFEPWQCTRYFTGGLFDYHDDCGNWASNEREYTVLLTIKQADFGGGTDFKNIGKQIDSKASRLIIWRNLDDTNRCDGKMQHSGMPVGKPGTEDEKMILVTWIRRFKYV